MAVTLSAGVRQNLLSLQQTADLMASTQNRLATGKKVNSALDNPANFFTSQGLQNRAGDLNSLLDSIGLAQKTLQAADQGLTSLTKLVQSAKSIAQQARSVSQPAIPYAAINSAGTADITAEAVGSFTTGAAHPATYTGGTISFTVNVDGTDVNLTTAAIADDSDGATVAAAINAAITGNATTNGRVTADFGTTTANRLTIAADDADVDIEITASALTASLGLTTDASTDRAIDSTNLLDGLAGLDGQSLTVTANGGSAVTVNFGSDTGEVSTMAELTTALTGSGVSAAIVASGSDNVLQLTVAATSGTQNSLAVSGSAAATFGVSTTTATGTAGAPTTTDASRADYQSQFNALLTQIDQLAKDTSFNGVNLLNGDDLKVVFNEKGTSSLTISGVTFDAAGLGLTAVSGTGFQTNANIDTTLASIDTALNTLRTQASSFGSSLTTVQTRQDFTKSLITTLQTGADALVLADTNEEGANLLALQTRQQLSTTALSLANQANQAVLRLF
jgi:flagellin-like hook-associated protein FlgL